MDRTTISLCLALVVLSPLAVSAQHVYKCVDRNGATYQSEPCAERKQQIRQWQAIPEPPPSPAQVARQRAAQAQGIRESAYLRSLARRASTGARRPTPMGVSISAARNGDRCAMAKKRRDEAEARQGLDRTFESMRRHVELVSEACR